MRLARCMLLIPLIVFSLGALADERPVTPEPGEDTMLFGGRTAREFFQARQSDSACRSALKTERETYRSLKSALADLVAAGAEAETIELKEQEVDQARERLIDRIEVCGECATRPIEKRVVPTASRSEVWYIADGSCWVGPEVAKEGYARARASLRDVSKYAKKTGGFHWLLEFVGVEPRTGELQPEVRTIERFPFTSFIALKGVKILGQQVAYTQVFRLDWQDKKKDALKETIVRFNGVRPPRGFSAPSVTDVRANGEVIPTIQMKVSKTQAFWYFNSDGYLRYYTAGDFGLDIDLAERIGRRMIQETVLDFSERF